MRRVLPAGVWRGMTDFVFKTDPAGIGRAVAIVLGLASCAAGFAVGFVADRVGMARRALARSEHSALRSKQELG